MLLQNSWLWYCSKETQTNSAPEHKMPEIKKYDNMKNNYNQHSEEK